MHVTALFDKNEGGLGVPRPIPANREGDSSFKKLVLAKKKLKLQRPLEVAKHKRVFLVCNILLVSVCLCLGSCVWPYQAPSGADVYH